MVDTLVPIYSFKSVTLFVLIMTNWICIQIVITRTYSLNNPQTFIFLNFTFNITRVPTILKKTNNIKYIILFIQ